MNRFAAIDIGSNAMRCHIVEVTSSAEPRVLESIREPVRLGSRVFLTGRIGEARMKRAVDAFRLFVSLIRSHEVTLVRAVATSAVREAADGQEFIDQVRDATGIELTIIDGAEEAHLVRRAVAAKLDMSTGRAAAVDVGGGSVEILCVSEGEVLRAESFTVGAVRLLEAIDDVEGQGNPDFFSLLEDYLSAIRSRVATALGEEPADLMAATGGSAETLARIIGVEVEGPPALAPGVRRMSVSRLRKFARELAGLSFKERMETYDLRADRADVILPAAMIYLKVGEILGVKRIYVPGTGLKDGLILDMVDALQRRGVIESRSQEVRGAALGLGERYRIDVPHAVLVTDLALSLFDQLGDLHRLPPETRMLLEAAGLLHDIGIFISAGKHHKHSWYIISESEVVGLNARQREIVANIARYHRKRHPTLKHPPFAALSPTEQETVAKLAAILRVADVLDREHSQHVKSLRAVRGEETMVLEVTADRELRLERWAAPRKFQLFEELFETQIKLVIADAEPSDDRELEVKLLVNSREELEQLGSLPELGGLPSVALTEGLQEDTYFDTTDFHLFRAGLSLRHRVKKGKRKATLKEILPTEDRPLLADRGEWEEPLEDAAHIGTVGAIGERLAPILAGRELKPLATLRTMRTKKTLGHSPEASAELCLDRVEVFFPGSEEPAGAFFELEAEDRGLGPDALGALGLELVESHGLAGSDLSKFERALLLLGLLDGAGKSRET